MTDENYYLVELYAIAQLKDYYDVMSCRVDWRQYNIDLPTELAKIRGTIYNGTFDPLCLNTLRPGTYCSFAGIVTKCSHYWCSCYEDEDWEEHYGSNRSYPSNSDEDEEYWEEEYSGDSDEEDGLFGMS